MINPFVTCRECEGWGNFSCEYCSEYEVECEHGEPCKACKGTGRTLHPPGVVECAHLYDGAPVKCNAWAYAAERYITLREEQVYFQICKESK